MDHFEIKTTIVESTIKMYLIMILKHYFDSYTNNIVIKSTNIKQDILFNLIKLYLFCEAFLIICVNARSPHNAPQK